MKKWIKALFGGSATEQHSMPPVDMVKREPGTQDSDTPFIVTLSDGQLIRAERLLATSRGIEITSVGDLKTEVTPRNIQHLFREGSQQSVSLDAVAYERSAIAMGLIEVEHLLLNYLAAEKNPDRGSLKQEIVVFGSSSLALSILPARTSHDIDVAVTDRFVTYANERMPYSRNPNHIDLEFCPRWLLRHCGDWEDRCSSLVGNSGIQFKVVHPLDTVSQKLLRLSASVFDKKDKEDIRQIVALLNPERETVVKLLKEGASRFSLIEKDTSEAVRRNTNWFIKTFSFNINLDEDIIKPVSLSENHELERLHLRPVVSPQRWRDIVPSEPSGLRAKREGDE